ncbi:hypothetical protein AO269_20005 [Pseudomonas putida]|uniref:HNH endonuclease n=1 Tax=Pseudomonas coronafaciens TaxID=53409 RepID=UPI00073B7B6D|nr:HNH endonuclease [Pseudomonas coronafaciens]KTC40125.1 hypothetical protein AO269_20005 [Pseudomonas putida]
MSLLKILKVDPNSPSGLVWTETNLKRKAGAKAGTLSNGYWIIGWKGTTYKAHRLIWEMLHGPIPEGRVIDHIDGNRAHNDPKNLRLATPSQNNQNKAMKADASMAISKNVYEVRPGYFQVIVRAHGTTHRTNTKDEIEAHWMAHILRERLHSHFMHD